MDTETLSKADGCLNHHTGARRLVCEDCQLKFPQVSNEEFIKAVFADGHEPSLFYGTESGLTVEVLSDEKAYAFVCRDSVFPIEASWKLLIGPGQYEMGVFLKEPVEYPRERSPMGMSWVASLPEGTSITDGETYRRQLVEWHPERRYTWEELVAASS